MGYVHKQFLNPIDWGVLRIIRKRQGFAPSEKWEPALRNAILMFSYQQLVTGIVILACGFSQLSSGLYSFHWQIIVYLAWFSSLDPLEDSDRNRRWATNNSQYMRHRLILS
jgi:hypothetical protein